MKRQPAVDVCADLPPDFEELFVLSPGSVEKFLATGVDGWRALLGEGIIYSGESHLAKGYKISRGDPEFYGALYCLDGHARFEVPGKVFQCGKGDMIVLPPHAWHRYECQGRWDIIWFHFAIAAGPWAKIFGDRIFTAKIDDVGTLVGLMDVFSREQASPNRSPLLLASLARSISLCIERMVRSEETAKGQRTRDMLDALWQRVRMDIARGWTVKSLAKETGVSAAQLHRWCTEQLGASPMHHVRTMRLQLAAELLSHSALTVAEISERVGYGSAFSLSKAMKAEFGTPPSEYRAHGDASGAK